MYPYSLPVIPFGLMRMQANYIPYSPSPSDKSSILIREITIHNDTVPLSPGTVHNIIYGNNLTPMLLGNMIERLLTTIDKQQKDYNTMISILQQNNNALCKELAKNANDNTLPDGFEENHGYVTTSIPLSHRLYTPTKWVKKLPNSKITCYSDQQGDTNP